jgi:hypothetical protein
MDKISPEVLIYLQSVKNYFETNTEARDFFLKDSNEELFYEHMKKIAQLNFDKKGDATLDREQFELLRRTIVAITIATSKTFVKKVEFKKEDFDYDNGVFIGFPNFGMICLN